MAYRHMRLFGLAVVFGAFAASSQALLVDPSGGNVYFSAANGSYDDSTATANLGGTFQLFGGAISSLTICVNGHMNGSGSSAYSNQVFPYNGVTNMIAPFWDDLYIHQGDGGSLSDKAGAGWYAATWNVEHISDANARITAQALLINSNQTIHNFNFLAGDIAFSYDSATSPGNVLSSTVGLNSGTGAFALGTGTNNGAETGSDIPNFVATNQFFLFRPDGNGGYVSSIQTAAAPEPASLAVLGLGALALIRRRRNRK